MIPQMQTTPTNCFAACVATLLERPVEEMPLSMDGATWDMAESQSWLFSQHRMQFVEINLLPGGVLFCIPAPVLCILTGPSQSPVPKIPLHSVVAKCAGMDGFVFVHDPQPGGQWLDGDPVSVTFLVPIDVCSHDRPTDTP